MKKSTLIIISILLLIIIAITFRLIHSPTNKHLHQTAASIIVTKVISRSAPLFIKTQGTIEASQSVAIQPQVTGIIKKIGFTAGQEVKTGQLLFEIDPVTYQAALVKTQANLAKDEASLRATEKDKASYELLVKKGFVSQQQYNQIKAQFGEQSSMIKLDKAAILQAQAELNYTQIKAPIDGKTGDITVKEGELVSAPNSKVLVTINQLNPVFVDFYLPQDYLTLLMQYQNKNSSLSVKIYSENQGQLLDTAQLSFIDNTVNSNTGTILLKATAPNKNHLLWPGQSVSVKLIFTIDKNILAIPSQAVQTDQQGQFVYLIKNNQAYITHIKILRQIGHWTFINQGLNQDDLVAITFPPDLQDKSPITILSSVSQQEKS